MRLRPLALLGLLLVICGCGAEVTADPKAEIFNYNQVAVGDSFAGEAIGFGGATPPGTMGWLGEQGYTTVINLRLAKEDGVDLEAAMAAADAAGLSYVHLPFNSTNPDPAVIEQFMSVLADPANQPVYVHCGSATRAAALWMIGRVTRDGLTPEQAAAEAAQIAGRPEAAIEFARAYLAAVEN